MSFPLETIVARAKRKGFVYPNSDIYGGLANAWDYGPYGALLKKNISDLWIKYFVQDRSDMVLMDTAIIANPQTWVASGHAGNFGDALIDDKNTRQRFRADKILENRIESKILGLEKNKNLEPLELVQLIPSELPQSNKIEEALAIGTKFAQEHCINSSLIAVQETNWGLSGVFTLKDNIKDSSIKTESVDLEEFKKSPYLKRKYYEFHMIKILQKNYGIANLIPESRGNEKMTEVIKAEILNNPDTGSKADRTEARQFNLMLQTQLGVIEDASAKAYLRPETCQSLFTNFKNLCDTTRIRIPFGMAQIGKAFRNEITPGQFLYRTREFEQMEIEYFVENDPAVADKAFQMRKELSMKFWQEQIQLKSENLRFREHEKDELSFYSAGTFDVEYNYPWGWGELQGIANRTDYDLKQHQQTSGKELQYSDPKSGKRYIPYVIEPSFGLSRTVMAVMMDCYDEETLTKEDGSTDVRTVIRFPFQLAPIKYAILPLLEKNEEMVALGETIYKSLRSKYNCDFDTGGGIGKRYRRQDEIGTPYCICVDHQSLEDGTVTIRHRDSMEQTRVSWTEIGK